jgi:hypothetical protein
VTGGEYGSPAVCFLEAGSAGTVIGGDINGTGVIERQRAICYLELGGIVLLERGAATGYCGIIVEDEAESTASHRTVGLSSGKVDG